MDAEYIAGLFVVEGHQGHGTGHQLISEVKRKNRLSLHAYEKNACLLYTSRYMRIPDVKKDGALVFQNDIRMIGLCPWEGDE